MAEVSERIKPYCAVYRARFLVLLQYRGAAFAGMMTQLWWGAMKIMVLAAFYRQAPAQPLPLSDAVTYLWLIQAFLTILPWNSDQDINQMVRSGNVIFERLRPLETYEFWYARSLALRTAPALLRAAPLFLLAGGVLPMAGMGEWGLRPPSGLTAAVLFSISMTMAILLSAALTTLSSIRMVSMLNGRGVNGLMTCLIVGFSGMIVPLQLFPDWAQPVLFVQPFASLMDIPYRIYFGGLSEVWAAVGIACQFGWLVMFVALGRGAMRRAMERIEVQGG